MAAYMGGKIRARSFLLLILVTAILFRFLYLGATDYFFDETFHAQAARLLARDNLSPWEFFNGEQPPVFTWLNGFAVSLFGLSEFSVRFVSAFFGTLMIILVYFVARMYYDNRTALVSSAILAVMPIHILYSRTSFSDMTLSFFLLVSIFLVEAAQKSKERNIRNMCLVLSGVSFALSFLTKYNALVLWALYWFFLLVHLRRSFPFYEFILSHAAAFLAIIIFAGFKIRFLFLLAYNVVNWGVLQSVTLNQPFSYYFYVLFDGLSPFLFVLLFLFIGISFYEYFASRKDSLVLFLVVAYLVVVFVQARKYPRHLVMILPFLAILVGHRLALLRKKLFCITFLIVVISCASFSLYWVGKINDFHPLRETGQYLEDNLPINSTIHISWTNVWPLKYYMGEEFSSFRWGRHYVRGSRLGLLVNDRLDASLVSQGDYVILANFNNHVTGHSPLEDNIMLFASHYNPYPQDYVMFVKDNGVLRKTISSKNCEVMIYEITKPSGGFFSPPPEARPGRLVCAFKRFQGIIPSELVEKLSKC